MEHHHEATAEQRLFHHARTLREGLAEKRNVILLVATLIATLTFQAALNPPGGVWQADSPANYSGIPYRAGESVMAYNHPDAYATFCIANLIGFIASLSTIFLLMTALRSRNHFLSGVLIGALIGVMCLTIISVLVIVAVSVAAITPENVKEKIHIQFGIVVGIIVYCILLISPMTALVAICFLIPHGTVDVNHANGDVEAPQIQVDVNHVNGDQEAPLIQLT
ncbi:uncharacterized protein LOC132273153 [Cornus florida]|uniref:uncharacterized protein LOC132273153 n=1 Tax=Cornus florida TaxID=4283 RepID=UPI0028A1EF3F|nr:uncharacterized protein LOC132273153 [Cornus florida]